MMMIRIEMKRRVWIRMRVRRKMDDDKAEDEEVNVDEAEGEKKE